MLVKSGRYGPYVSHAGVNATLPADTAPDSLTLHQGLDLLRAREARGKKPPVAPRRAAARKRAGETTSAKPTLQAASVEKKPRRKAKGG